MFSSRHASRCLFILSTILEKDKRRTKDLNHDGPRNEDSTCISEEDTALKEVGLGLHEEQQREGQACSHRKWEGQGERETKTTGEETRVLKPEQYKGHEEEREGNPGRAAYLIGLTGTLLKALWLFAGPSCKLGAASMLK